MDVNTNYNSIPIAEISTWGKVPPQSLDLEEAVLGACLLEKQAVVKATNLLTPDHFYSQANNLVFSAIINLSDTEKPVDILTVTEELKKLGTLEQAGGAQYISLLTNRIASGANVEHHARIVLQKFIQREVIKLSTTAIQTAYDDSVDVFELHDQLISDLIKLSSNLTKDRITHISQPAAENMKKIEQLSKDPGKLLGYSTGLVELDKLTHGIQPGVIVIAGRPSMGKSAILSQIAIEISRVVPVQIFTLEVSAAKYELRMKSQLSGIHYERIQTGNIYRDEWEKLSNVSFEISEMPIWIDDCATISPVQLRSKCLQAYSERGVRCFAIDFIQLADGGNDYQKLSDMSRAVKIVSQDLGIPFIELSQLSREVEKRPDKKPMLSDLKQTGSLEADADVVMLLYRPEYYNIKTDHTGCLYPPGLAQIRVAKNKDGKVGTVDVKFEGDNVIFKNLEEAIF